MTAHSKEVGVLGTPDWCKNSNREADGVEDSNAAYLHNCSPVLVEFAAQRSKGMDGILARISCRLIPHHLQKKQGGLQLITYFSHLFFPDSHMREHWPRARYILHVRRK